MNNKDYLFNEYKLKENFTDWEEPIPKYFYHASWSKNLESILEKGLLAKSPQKVWEWCSDDVFLSTYKEVAMNTLTTYLDSEENSSRFAGENIIVFAIDSNGIDASLLEEDFNWCADDGIIPESWKYPKDIDPKYISICRVVKLEWGE